MSLLVSREQAENAFADALRLYVGKRRRYSYEDFANGIGLTKDGRAHTKPLYDFLSYPAGSPDHRPLHFGITLSITKFLGCEFTNAWLALAEQRACDDAPIDHDELAPAFQEYLQAKSAAHHPDSEARREIGPNEEKTLRSKLAAVPAAVVVQ